LWQVLPTVSKSAQLRSGQLTHPLHVACGWDARGGRVRAPQHGTISKGLDAESQDSKAISARNSHLVAVVDIKPPRTADTWYAENVATTVTGRVTVAIDNHQQGCFVRPELRSVDSVDQGVRDMWQVCRAAEQVRKLPVPVQPVRV
jgi:hypothetical protein